MMLAEMNTTTTTDEAADDTGADLATGHEVPGDDAELIPPQVAMVMSALEAGRATREERRANRRGTFRTTSKLHLFRDGPNPPARVIYTRDIDRRGVGFITPHRLPLGYGGVLHLPDDKGGQIEVHCTLLRCREAAPGWFEGSAYFNRDQPQFDR